MNPPFHHNKRDVYDKTTTNWYLIIKIKCNQSAIRLPSCKFCVERDLLVFDGLWNCCCTKGGSQLSLIIVCVNTIGCCLVTFEIINFHTFIFSPFCKLHFTPCKSLWINKKNKPLYVFLLLNGFIFYKYFSLTLLNYTTPWL